VSTHWVAPLTMLLPLDETFKKLSWHVCKQRLVLQGDYHIMAILKLECVQSTFFPSHWWMPQMNCPPHMGVTWHSYLEYHELVREHWQQCLVAYYLSHIQKLCIAPCTNNESKYHQ